MEGAINISGAGNTRGKSARGYKRERARHNASEATLKLDAPSPCGVLVSLPLGTARNLSLGSSCVYKLVSLPVWDYYIFFRSL